MLRHHSTSGGLLRLIFILGLICVAAVLLAPLLLNKPIANEINKHFDGSINVDKAEFSVWPLRLRLHDVTIKNPKNYKSDDMLAIGEVTLHMDYTNAQTVIIQRLVFSEVSGYPAFVDNVDNFVAYQDYLDKQKAKIPTGIWRWPVIVQTVQVRNAWIGNQDPMLKLEDRNFDPIGRMQNPVSLQEAVIESLDHVLLQQRKAIPQLMLDKVKGKVSGALDALGKKLQELSQ